jgi:hypothetical protein
MHIAIHNFGDEDYLLPPMEIKAANKPYAMVMELMP